MELTGATLCLCNCQMIFVTAGIACSHYMSTWSSSRNIEEGVFDRGALQRLQAIFEKVCRDFQAQLVEMNGQAEHVHLLINYPPKHSASSMVNSLQGVSSRLLRIERPDIERRYWNHVLVAFLLRRQLWRGTAGHY
jgi:REP element-mobilizing transposase RayT